MLDDVPVRFWLLLLLAMLAAAPVKNLAAAVRAAGPRDVTIPRKGEEPSSGGTLWSVAALAAIAAVAGFIFTPQAEQLAQADAFLPALIGAGALFGAFLVARDIVRGRIEPFSKGSWKTYQRATQPKRFWASVLWNSMFVGFAFFLSAQMFRETRHDRWEATCMGRGDRPDPAKMVSACGNLLESGAGDSEHRAIWLTSRSIMKTNLREYGPALADADAALKLVPDNEWAIVARGLANSRQHDFNRAIADYNLAIARNPKSAGAYYYRGLAYSGLGEYAKAVEDFDAVTQLNPDDVEAVTLRAEMHENLGQPAAAAADRALAEQLRRKTPAPR